jgi:TonB family protein
MDLLQPANLVAWALQAGVVVLVATPLPRLLGLWSPRARMGYWRVVLVGCLLLPLLQPWVIRQQAVQPNASTAAVVVRGDAGPSGADVPASAAGPPGTPVWWPRIGVAEVLVAGILLRLAWLGLGVITVGRLRRAARPLWPRPPSVDRAATLVETDAEFLVSATSSRPVTCGLLWPVVLVPRTFETFPEHEQTAIATHELLHVSRADWVRNAFDEVVRAILWFHPGIWFVINQIQLAREQVVDREAVRRLGTRQPYLEALLRLAKPAPRLVLTPASLFLKRAHLRQRVTLLVKEASMSRARIVGSLAVMAVVIFIGGRMATAAFPLQQSGAKTPGVATAAPKLTPAKIGSFDYENAPIRSVLSAFSAMTGIAVTTEIPDRVLDQPITVKFSAGISPEQVLSFIAQAIGGTYRVTSERSVVLTGTSSPGTRSSGTAAGAARPGVSTGSGTGTGVGGGVPGGRGAGVGGGVGGGVVGGVPGGASGGIAGGAAGGVAGGVGGGVAGPTGFDTAALLAGSLGSGTTNLITRGMPSVSGTTGTAKVFVTIDSTGNVLRTGFVSATTGDLVAAAVEAARQWVFEPSDLPERETAIGFNFAAAPGSQDAPVIRVGGNVPPPTKVRDIKPIYPKEAIDARIQGVQILEITIDPAGDVVDARALRGQRVLVGAAIDAVLQWKFTPWDGPERRLMTVTVNFTLDGGSGAPMPARDASAGGAGMVAPLPAQWPPDAIRVGGNVRPPNRIVDVKPVYPDVAQKARVQGVVIFDVLIGPDGKVKDARILRSIPLLDRAAYDAVLQWEFTPTLLNGNPISIVMTCTVNFTLQ